MDNSNEVNWTIHVSASLEQKDEAEQLMQQFIKEVKALGAKTHLDSGMMLLKHEDLSKQSVDYFKKLLRQQGMPEELIERQAKILHAETAGGSWDEVIADIEDELNEAKRAKELHKVYSSLISLINILVNQGYKPKAISYFKEAETLFNETPVEKLINIPSDRVPPEEYFEGAKIGFQKQLERLRNWLI